MKDYGTEDLGDWITFEEIHGGETYVLRKRCFQGLKMNHADEQTGRPAFYHVIMDRGVVMVTKETYSKISDILLLI